MIDFENEFGEKTEEVRSNYLKDTETGDVFYRLDIFSPLQKHVSEMKEEYPELRILGVKEGYIDLVVNKEGEKIIRNNITIILKNGDEEPYYVNTSLKLQQRYAECILQDLEENFLDGKNEEREEEKG